MSTHDGGKPHVKELPYSPPLGPKHQSHERPGLGGGTNHGHAGTQGRHGTSDRESGRSGLGGQDLPHGSERK